MQGIKKSFCLINIEIFLVCAIPYFLVFSIFLADSSMIILCGIFIFKFLKKKTNELNFKYLILLGICWLYIVISSFFSPDLYLSLKSTLFYFRFIFFPCTIFLLITENKSFLKKFLFSSLFLILLLFIDGLVEHIRGENLLGYKKYEIGRIASLFKDEYIYGTFMLKIFYPIAAIIYFLSKPKFKNFYFITFYIIIFFCIFISGDRTPLLLFLISSILILFLFKTKFRNKAIFVSLLLLLSTTFLISNKSLYDRLISRTLVDFGSEKGLVFENDRLTVFNYKGKDLSFMPQHQTYIIISINMFKDKPIFGHGPRAFKKLSCDEYKINQFSCSSHPHNFYLQLLSETGIIGFFLLFLFFLYICMILFIEIFTSKKKLTFELQLLIVSIFINLFPITQTGNFLSNWNSIALYLPIGFYFGIKKILYNEKKFY